MPYLNIRVSALKSAVIAEKIINVLMEHTSTVLGKKADVTSIEISFIDPKEWFIGGQCVADQLLTTFYLDIKITEGTNTKAEKSLYVKQVFNDLDSLLGPLAPASYIVIDDVRGDSWGFEGCTQEYRFIQSQLL